MSDTPDLATSTPAGKSGSTLVYCQLPGGGGTIITSLNHCTILGGTDVSKAPPAGTALVACSYAGKTIHTRASDCTMIGGTSQGPVTQSGDET